MNRLDQYKGPIAWMARNSVAANLLMLLFLVGGSLFIFQVKQEVFPEVELDIVSIAVPYPGASPAEVEQGIILAIEEEVRGLDGVKRVISAANEGAGVVTVELLRTANPNKALQDVKSAVDRISSLPLEAERPIVSLLTNRFRVISLVLYGDLPEDILRNLGQQIREELLAEPNITFVELDGVRELEISVEVSKDTLRAHNLLLEDVAREIQRTAVELPAGGVKTSAGEVLLRTAERRDYGSEFYNIPVKNLPDGTNVRLGEIATITDGFRESDVARYFNGKPAVMIEVFRIGDEKPIEISDTVKAYAERLKETLPPTVQVATWFDSSEMYNDRINLLVRNAFLGLALVLLILGLFLEIRLAFWVTLGIPISILGTFIFLPPFDVSINMISLFAFIVTLGIIVDDAIIVGENIFEYRRQGMDPLEAAIKGAKEISVPVAFSILTNVAAFMPLLFIPGISGKFWRVIPITVITVFLISWIESVFILPSHLAGLKLASKTKFYGFIHRYQQKFTDLLEWLVKWTYYPTVKFAVENRYLTLACGIAVLLLTVGYVGGGKIKFTYMPKVDTDIISVNAVLPFGSPIAETQKIQKRILESAQEVIAEHGGDRVLRGMLSSTGMLSGRQGGDGGRGDNNSHLTTIEVYLVPAGERDFTATQFANLWRSKLGVIPGLESLTFDYSTGPSSGSPIDIELNHSNIETLRIASAELAGKLSTFAGVKDIDDGFNEGKPQYDLQVKPEARSLGITAADLASQVRSAFYGARAFRQQRGRDEVWVMIKLPETERRSEYDIEELLIRTPGGGEIPLREAAVVTRGRSYTEITRTDGRRVVNVQADIDPAVTNAGEVLASVQENILPTLLAQYPGLGYSLEGEQREQRDAMSSMGRGFVLALLAIFAMLAIPFKSYIQPLIVMAAIPFGIVGALLGHIIMGYDISIISLMGIVALSGVVVNDSLVLVVTANGNRDKGTPVNGAIIEACIRRFRPIILTSITTYCGLAPMIFETSVQARFLIPMAISLGYGILFSTFIVLLIVPSLYLMVEDFKSLFRFIYGQEQERLDVPETAA